MYLAFYAAGWMQFQAISLFIVIFIALAFFINEDRCNQYVAW